MVFSSHLFVFYFLPITLGLYFLCPRKGKHLLLTVLSYVFYGWANPCFVFLMLASTFLDYFCGQWICGRWRMPILGRGEPAGPQSDLYALGVMFYEMLLGRRPYEADTVSGLITQHLKAPIPRLPAELADYQYIIDRLLAKTPAERYLTADEVLAGIDEVWTRLSIRAMGDPRPS